MPIREPIFKSSLVNEISSFIDAKRREKYGENNPDFLSIIEFIDRFKLLPYGLFPVQKFIVKLYYNIPLDDKLPENESNRIKVTDRFGNKVLYEFSEVEYLKFLFSQGRCNISEQDGKERRELILSLGRRSGKSALSAIFAAYELYKLLRRGHPQSYYGMPSGSEIRVLCVANDKEQASIVYGDMQGHIQAVDYFKNSLAHNTQTFIKFRTEQDRQRYGDEGKSTITATFKSSIAKGLRGRGIICCILDEIAFFVDNGKSSAEQVYRAISPSLAQFSQKDSINKHIPIGPTEGRMIMISSPDAKEGFFYKMYHQAMAGDKASVNTLMIQAPTWEVNPTLSKEYYEVEYHKDPRAFMTEHGAEFSDRVRGWIEDARDLTECIDPNLKPMTRGIPREPHFGGFDFGLTNDGTAVALTKFYRGKLVLAYHEAWYAGRRWRDVNPHLEAPMVPYALTLQDRNRLDIAEISEWIKILSTRFYIIRGILDQWSGIVIEQELHRRGLNQIEMRNFFDTQSSQMYQNMKMFLYNRNLVLYDHPVPPESNKHSPIITELLELQATSGGKNIILVEAPAVKGKHDDVSDALARSVLVASEYMKVNPGIMSSNFMGPTQGPAPKQTTGYYNFHRMKNRMHGIVKERFVPRQLRRF